ncbi:MAG TPA: hypothetical protein DCE44_07160, partial [Verrucomicrobiales bacterium]|nr:hypothetical protein [Verrucomicrobiales bacterium]
MKELPAITLAKLTVLTKKPSKNDPSIQVHFNPASLQLTLSSELKDNSKNGPKQYIAKATAKLKFELLFDTTDTGENVVNTTKKLQQLVIPENFKAPSKSNPTQVPPPTVKFDWGALVFQGVTEGYQETIDFFSADGVPLRATVSMTLSQQDNVFGQGEKKDPADVGLLEDLSSIVTTQGTSPAGAADKGNSPKAARGVAMANGAESLRASFQGSLAVGATVELSGPIAFAGAGGSFGASAGGGLGVELGGSAGISGGLSGGIGGGVSAGFSAGASAGFSGGISGGASARFGASASAGFSMGGEASVGGLARLSAT